MLLNPNRELATLPCVSKLYLTVNVAHLDICEQ